MVIRMAPPANGKRFRAAVEELPESDLNDLLEDVPEEEWSDD